MKGVFDCSLSSTSTIFLEYNISSTFSWSTGMNTKFHKYIHRALLWTVMSICFHKLVLWNRKVFPMLSLQIDHFPVFQKNNFWKIQKILLFSLMKLCLEYWQFFIFPWLTSWARIIRGSSNLPSQNECANFFWKCSDLYCIFTYFTSLSKYCVRCVVFLEVSCSN